MTDWRRPYEPTANMLGGAIVACAGIVFCVVLTVVLIAGVSGLFRVEVADFAVPHALTAVGSYRYRVGVYHKDIGVRPVDRSSG